MTGKKANLHQIKTHHKRRIRIYEDEWPWIAENHEKGEGMFARMKRKAKRQRLYVEFRPITKKSFYSLMDSHAELFDYIADHGEEYNKLRLLRLQNVAKSILHNFTDADFEFMVEFGNKILPLQYAFVAEMLRGAHGSILESFNDRLAFARRIAVKQGWDHMQFEMFLGRLSPIMLPDQVQVQMMENLAKDPSIQARADDISEELLASDDPTYLQDQFNKILLNEIGKSKAKEDEIAMTKMIQKIMGKI